MVDADVDTSPEEKKGFLYKCTGGQIGARQLTALIFGALTIFSLGGIVFGFAAVFPIFQADGNFVSGCGKKCLSHLRSCKCEGQTLLMQTVTTVGFFSADFCAVIWGVVIDRITPPKSLAFATAIAVAGLLMLAFAVFTSQDIDTAPHPTSDILISVSLILIGAAGPGIGSSTLVGLLQLPGAPRTAFFESAVSCLVAGVFDLSALVFAVFYIFDGIGFGLPYSCTSWAAFGGTVAVLLITVGFALPQTGPSEKTALLSKPITPDGPSPTPLETMKEIEMKKEKEEEETYAWVRPTYVNGLISLLFGPRLATTTFSSKTDMAAADALAEQAAMPAGRAPAEKFTAVPMEAVPEDHAAAPSSPRKPFFRSLRPCYTCGGVLTRPLLASLLTGHNVLLVFSMGIFNLFSTIYLTTHQDNFDLMFGATTSSILSNQLNFAFPIIGFVGSFLAVPFFASVSSETPFVVILILNTAFVACEMVDNLKAQYVAAFMFGLVRMFNWATFYHYISSNPMLYKPHLVGRCLGYNGMMIAIIGDALSPLLMSYTANGTNPPSKAARYQILKIFLLFSQLPINILLPWWVRRQRLREPSERKEGGGF